MSVAERIRRVRTAPGGRPVRGGRAELPVEEKEEEEDDDDDDDEEEEEEEEEVEEEEDFRGFTVEVEKGRDGGGGGV